MRRRSRVWLSALAAAACMPVWGQRYPPKETGPASVIVRLLDRKGEPAAAPDGLRIRVNGHEAPVASVTPLTDEPQSVCVLWDNSGSTWETTATAQNELKRLAETLPAKDSMCVIAFAEKVALVTDFMEPRSAVAAAARTLPKPYGKSATVDAVLFTQKYMEERAPERSHVIVLIGDGDDNASVQKQYQLLAGLNEPNAPTVFVMVNPGEAMAKPTGAFWLAKNTGGVAYKLTDYSHPDAVVDKLVRVIQARYRLTFSESSGASGDLPLQMEVAGPSKTAIHSILAAKN